MNYRREIDGLRALAILSVILYHAGFKTFSGGYVGVDVFFVISGYLITSIIVFELNQASFSIINFYERRARRILPALFFVMFSCIPLAWFLLLPSDMKDFSQSLIAVPLFASNLLFWHRSGYFETIAELKPLIHTWSLALEEQFYLFFPAVMLFFRSLGERWIIIVLLGIFSSSFLLANIYVYTEPPSSGASSAFFLLPSRSWELLIGVFAAMYLSKRSITTSLVSEVGGFIGFFSILYSTCFFNKDTPFPGVNALIPTFGALLIILFANQKTIIGKLMGNKILVGVGLISYSAYLWHQPLFAFARHTSLTEPTQIVFVSLSILSFILAYLSWFYIETPFRNREKFTPKQIFCFFLLGSISLISIGFLGHKEDGYKSRVRKIYNGDIGTSEFYQYIDEKYFDCEPQSIAKQALSWNGYLRCKQSKIGTPDTILLGDSHAEHLFLGLAEQRSQNNIAFYITSGKPYLDNPAYKLIFDELLGNHKVQNILLTMHFFGRLDPDNSDLYEEFSKTIKALKTSGKKVVLVGDVPRFNKDPSYCVYQFSSQTNSENCYLSINDIEYQRKIYRTELIRLSRENDTPYIDLDRQRP